jgi:hypothetical protein
MWFFEVRQKRFLSTFCASGHRFVLSCSRPTPVTLPSKTAPGMPMRNFTFHPWHGGVHSSSVYLAYVAQRLRGRGIKVERGVLPEFVRKRVVP